MDEEEYLYGCDICGERKDCASDIVWLTSSFGVCQDCYDKIPYEIRLKMQEDCFDNEVQAWIDEHCSRIKQ